MDTTGTTVTSSFDPVAEHARTRAALAAAVPRLVRLLKAVPDAGAPSGVPDWTVGDVAAHLAAASLAYGSAVGAEDDLDWAALLPPGDDLSFAERVTAVNATALTLFGPDERAGLPGFLAERAESFLEATEGLAPDTPVTTPWYGPGVAVTLATVTGLMLSETLVHGLDIARGARLPWSIGPEEAGLVIGQSMPTMMALALDEEKARGVSLAVDLVVRGGGPRLAVVVDGGAMTVTRDAAPRPYDCRLTVEPRAFLLVAFRRAPRWKAIASGRMRAGGRRPWLATRLADLVAGP
ncbi:maleylpyruvate isomerase N-terminal domain-containing protein [Streptomyces sp. NPDC020807]|uniref:maleylpyruvate isomerase N-terminal domain-containing protein n=1 Tax=Streptomyces sp. NPDC020807 TaxID=3155119 RepID=UPI0033C265E3